MKTGSRGGGRKGGREGGREGGRGGETEGGIVLFENFEISKSCSYKLLQHNMHSTDDICF